jgi:hypothetical protein
MGFYMFEEDGSCSGGYNGLLEYEGDVYFVVAGIPKTGWQTVSNPDRSVVFYYFDPATGAAVDGVKTIDGYTYTFKDKKLVRGQIVTDSYGSRYMWAGSWSSQEWLNIDGKIYYTGQNSYFYTGFRYQYSAEGVWTHYSFAADGHLMTEYTGIYEYNGGLYWLEAGIVDNYPGLVAVDGDLYYIASTNVMVKDRYYWISKPNGIVPEGSYYFDKDGKMTIVKKYRGNFDKALAMYVKDRLADREDLVGDILFVTKTPVSDECYCAVMKAVSEYGKFDTVYETNAGCTVSCHCGPGTLGVLFVRK